MGAQPACCKKQTLQDAYDFVIIGAGTAGCIIASELSLHPGVTVLLIEAGGHTATGVRNRGLQTIPGMEAWNVATKQIDWGYQLEPQEHVQSGFKDRRLPIPRGKVVGGSNELNACIHMRGVAGDYDAWARSTGDDSWSWANMEKHLVAYEDKLNMRATEVSLIDGAFGVASENAGYDWAGDDVTHAVTSLPGASPLSLTVSQKGTRLSTARSYLLPVMSKRPNLKLATGKQVVQLVIERAGDATKVSGVKFANGAIVKASKEVILCAGAYGTPHLLQLSGIGSKAELEKVGIETHLDLPGVGENLQDHPLMLAKVRTRSGVGESFGKLLASTTSCKYLCCGRGVLSQTGVGSRLLCPSSPLWDSRPDLLVMPTVATLSYGLCHNFIGLQNDFCSGIGTPKDWRGLPECLASPVGGVPIASGFYCYLGLLHANARGSVKVKSSNPLAQPCIEFQAYADADDITRVLKGFRIIERLISDPAMKEFKAELLYHKDLAAEHGEGSDAYWAEYARRFGFLFWHPVGTCKMGKKEDASSVVDSRLKVHGLSSMRVADASIMPEITTGNTNAPVAAIALRCVELLRQDWPEDLLGSDRIGRGTGPD